jgi:ribonuclease HI
MKKVDIYTDGSCLNNPGKGGFGVVIISGDTRAEFSAGFQKTTNNRMELLGVIAALKSLNEAPCEITITTDSQYVVNGMTKWIYNWKKQNKLSQNSTKLANVDLWIALDKLANSHIIQWVWVKGHADHKENNRCDYLARTAANGTNLLIDSGY